MVSKLSRSVVSKPSSPGSPLFWSTQLRVQAGILGTLEPFELDLVLQVTKGLAATAERMWKGSGPPNPKPASTQSREESNDRERGSSVFTDSSPGTESWAQTRTHVGGGGWAWFSTENQKHSERPGGEGTASPGL